MNLDLLVLFLSTEILNSEKILTFGWQGLSQLLKLLMTLQPVMDYELDSTFAMTDFLQAYPIVCRVLQVSQMNQVAINQIPFKTTTLLPMIRCRS